MAAPTQITITFISTLPSTTSTAVIPVPATLQSLDSGQFAQTQSGYQAFETLISGVAKRGGFVFSDTTGVQTFIPLNMVTKITTP